MLGKGEEHEGARHLMGITGRERGFNAAKKGSGQVGFQSAPPAHPDVPSAAEDVLEAFLLEEEKEGSSDPTHVLDKMYSGFKEKEPDLGMDRYIGLGEEEIEQIEEARKSIVEIDAYDSVEMRDITRALGSSWGQTNESIATSTTRAKEDQSMFLVGDYYDYVDSNEAAAELTEMVEGEPFYSEADGKMQLVLDKVRSGKILLTKDDLTRLKKFKEHSYAVHAEVNSLERNQSLDADWISAGVQRKCELCGQFISTRDSHGSLSYGDTYSANVYNTIRNRNTGAKGQAVCNGGRRTIEISKEITAASMKVRPFETIKEGLRWGRFEKRETLETISPVSTDELTTELPEDWPTLLQVDKNKLPQYDEKLLEDVYMEGSHDIRGEVIALYGVKEGMSRSFSIRLPKNIREAVIEAPPFATHAIGGSEKTVLLDSSVVVLAAKIDPPLSEGEVKRMIDQGNEKVLNSFLAVKRTRAMAVDVISRYPSDALRGLATHPEGLSSELVEELSNSGDSTVRSYAASSPNLSSEAAIRLAKDPDPEVRKALIIPNTERNEKRQAVNIQNSSEPEKNRRSHTHEWHGDIYIGRSNLKSELRSVGEALINDPEPGIAVLAFSSTQMNGREDEWGQAFVKGKDGNLSTEQKYLISKVKTRERFNELKKHVLASPEQYNADFNDVAKFLAY